jgi:hypothetical protein
MLLSLSERNYSGVTPMPKATVRANARDLPEATHHPNADVQALAAEFEAARDPHPHRDYMTDEEVNVATDRQREIAEKVAALPSTDMSTMRLKARIYMWAEGADDLENFDNVQHDAVSGPVLVSLFRDLLAANEQPATDEQLAAMDFEPWAHKPDEWKPPLAEEWRDHINFVFPYIRLAWETMYKTKAELMTVAEGLDGEPLDELITGIGDSKKFFERFTDVLDAALVRLICAGTAVELKEALAGENA